MTHSDDHSIREEEDVQVGLDIRRKRSFEEMDMTPMVDITFLLLIFFMVTAAFALQKSLEVPPINEQEGGSSERWEQTEEDALMVRIDSDNVIWIEDRQIPSRGELLSVLRGSGKRETGFSTETLLVVADGQARYETVIMVLDVGHAVGMGNIRLKTQK